MKHSLVLTSEAVASGLFLLAGMAVARAEAPPSGWLTEGSTTATPYYVNAAPADGPTVFIVGGMHGDEPAGVYAADQIREWPLSRGKVVVVPRANVLGMNAGTRTLKLEDSTNRFDLNRAFPPKAGTTNPAARLAQSLWTLLQAQPPAWLLDLHEGGDFRARTTNSVGSSVISSASPEARRMGERMVNTLNASITHTERRFTLLKRPIRGSLARAAADDLGVRSFIVETTTKSQPLSLRARQHRIAVHTLLHELDMVDASVTPECMTPVKAAHGTTRVAVYDGAGIGGKGIPTVLTQLGGQTNVLTRRVSPEDIRAGVLKQFDVVMFTGGSGSGQGRALGQDGRAEVKRFVENGGGYLGICAGAYLACSGFSWGLGVIDAKTRSSLWQRGTDMVKLELTPRGRAVFGDRQGQFDCLYYQGPIVEPADAAAVPDFETLAFFRTEVAKNNTPKGIMVNSPAIFGGSFGKGRVLCFSPHPEQTKGLEAFLPQAVAWVAARESETAARR